LLTITRYQTLFLIGGGIGITPILGLIRDFIQQHQNQNNPFNGSSSVKHVRLLWITQDEGTCNWFANELNSLVGSQKVVVDIVVSMTKTNQITIQVNHLIFLNFL
jgi:hypothetical protein